MFVCYHTFWKPSQKLTFAQNKFNSITALLSLLCELFIKTCPLNKEYLWLKSLVTEIKCIVSNFLFLFLFLVLVFVSFSYLYLSPSCICICLSGRLFQKIFSFPLGSISTSFQPVGLLCSQSWTTALEKNGFNSNVSKSVNVIGFDPTKP